MMRRSLKISRGRDTSERFTDGTADRPARGSKNPEDGTIRSPVVVLGATGIIGGAVVRAAVEAGRPVVATGPDLRQLEQLRVDHAGADVTVLATTIAADADAGRLAALLRRDGRPIAGVVDAMSGDPGRGRLIDHPTEVLRRTLDEELLPHLSAARYLIPLLAEAKRGGSYLLIGGPGSESPWANYGFRSVAASALRMVACVLHDEARSLDVRVQMLMVGKPVRGEVACRYECSEWPSAAAIGRHAVHLISLRDAAGREGGVAPALVAASARAIVRHVNDVDSTLVPTTSTGRSYTDVPSFLSALNSQDRHEVNPDETP